ncbi:MAG: aminopeptidase [Sphaerochaetaceae bacterium]|jgi:aminopeptidase|nr:aminopeptidase [Sphaerochaetaceae bacterium]NLO61276.1 aminopeptidase [Spirochaetales bacterium]MDD3669829.1 aminopeptidase [Sphaerochaetaceae bacterium]MDD4259076.1 aminopeptidase [Sphaerochaetaceae bacterium]MDD4841582.1 aminopeptidase [Sphaerochaetaceae bacterium]
MDYRHNYIKVIVHVMLALRQDEGLSINTGRSHFEFASELAQFASEITLQDVNVVTIEHGVVEEVNSFSPIENEKSLHEPLRHVLLRIDDTEEHDWQPEASADEIIESMALLQQTGNLAPPQLDRHMAPWAMIAVPGPLWASKILGKNCEESKLWELFAPVYKLDQNNPVQAWKEHISLVNHRLVTLNRLEIDHIRITTKDTELTLACVDQSRWRGGLMHLGTGRTFIPMLPLDRVTMLPDRFRTDGVLTATRPFRLLAREIIGAKFLFSSGMVVDYDAVKGKDILDLVFSKEDNARRLGELSLIDEYYSLGSLCDRFDTLSLDTHLSSSVLFGMGEAIHLEALETYEDAKQMEQSTGCNLSDIRFRVPFGNKDMTVRAILSDGSEFVIINEGHIWS